MTTPKSKASFDTAMKKRIRSEIRMDLFKSLVKAQKIRAPRTKCSTISKGIIPQSLVAATASKKPFIKFMLIF